MAEKRTPGQIADPWADSVRHKEQQGALRETHDSKKLRSEKETRRRDDQDGRATGAAIKPPRRRR